MSDSELVEAPARLPVWRRVLHPALFTGWCVAGVVALAHHRNPSFEEIVAFVTAAAIVVVTPVQHSVGVARRRRARRSAEPDPFGLR
jgi:hypothetical protein